MNKHSLIYHLIQLSYALIAFALNVGLGFALPLLEPLLSDSLLHVLCLILCYFLPSPLAMSSSIKSLKDSWLLEIFAIVGSALSVLIIAVLLGIYNDRPILTWNGITLNAVVSVFSTVSKGLLAYSVSEGLGQAKWLWLSSNQERINDLDVIDDASRGPEGSLKLLWHSVARSWITLGALVIFLSLAMDPLFQLVLTTKDQLVYADDPATTISYAKRYSRGTWTYRAQYCEYLCVIRLHTKLHDQTLIHSADDKNHTFPYSSFHVSADQAIEAATFFGLSF